MQLILFTGLPGTGKSMLAERVSQKILVPVFAKDIIEAALLRCEVTSVLGGKQPVNYAAYEILLALGKQQLALNQSCIIDCVAGPLLVRNQFRAIAEKQNAKWIVIECVCSDEDTHRTRLTTRQRNIPGYRELDWDQLLATKERYTPWTEERMIVDSMNPVDDNLDMVLSYIELSLG